MFTNKHFTLFTIVIIAVAGVALLLAAIFYAPQPKLYAWYWQDGKVYRYDVNRHKSEDVSLPSTGKPYYVLLSNDAKKVAFIDDDGLKITSPREKTNELIKANYWFTLPNTSTLTKSFYYPLSWSPDGQSLILGHASWEFVALSILTIKDKIIRDIDAFYHLQSSWSPDSKSFLLSAPYAGVLCFECDDDLLSITVSDLNPQTIDLNSIGIDGAVWSEERIVVSKRVEALWHSQLLVLEPQTFKPTLLLEIPQGRLMTPLWARNGKKIYYVVETYDPNYINEVISNDLYSINTDTLLRTKLYSAKFIRLVSISPDDAWLVFEEKNPDKYSGLAFRMFNFSNKDLIELGHPDQNDEWWDIGFAGWELVK